MAATARWKRLVVVTGAIGVAAAIFSGPAAADLGLSPTLSGVVEQVAPTVTDTVEGVTSSVPQVAEPVQVPDVDAVLEEPQQAVSELVETVATESLTSQPPTSVTSTATSADPGSDPGAALPAPPATKQSAPADSSRAATPSAIPGARRDGSTAAPSATVRSATTAPSAPHRSTTPPARSPRSLAPLSPLMPGVIQVDTGAEQRVAGPGGRAPAAPEPPPRDFLAFEGLLPPAPASAVLIAVLLALLSLAVPRARGPRLDPTVADPHPAEVQFRLVRPG